MPRSEKQKAKILLIAKYLWEQTDEDHGVTAADIVDYLDDCGISAELHSIYRDIAVLRDEFGFDVEGGRGRKYRLASRDLEYNDLRVLAECVSGSRFVSKGQAERLVRALGTLCSEYQREALESETFVSDRTRTEERSVFINAAEIRSAIKQSVKISFKYAKASIDNLNEMVSRRNNAPYIVSPYAILVNDGNLYLLAYHDFSKKIMTFRVDRMRNVSCSDKPRSGQAAYDKINMQNYVRRVFGMYRGYRQRVVMEFDMALLDAVVDRLGTDDILYHADGRRIFTVNADIEVSPQFYAWIFGFGDKARIKAPTHIVEGMKKQLQEVSEKYQG